MDLKNFDFKNTEAQTLDLVNPSDGTALLQEDGTVVSITLHGADSDVFRNATRAYGNKKLSSTVTKKQTVEEVEEAACKILGTATVSWQGIEVNGEDLVCTEKSAIWLYTEYTWIREQVDAFVNERSNFLMIA